MFKKLLIIIIPFLLFSCSSRVDEAEVKKARQFFESVFQDNVLESPEFQASLGYKSNYDKWDDITWQASRQRAYRAKDDLAYLEKNIDSINLKIIELNNSINNVIKNNNRTGVDPIQIHQDMRWNCKEANTHKQGTLTPCYAIKFQRGP